MFIVSMEAKDHKCTLQTACGTTGHVSLKVIGSVGRATGGCEVTLIGRVTGGGRLTLMGRVHVDGVTGV